MSTDGCSGKMDVVAKFVNYFRTGEKGRKLSFTGCCDEHDLFYEQGGSRKDRAFADKILRECIKANLIKRKRSKWVQLHVPYIFWFFCKNIRMDILE